jgi:hypothetical protein
MHVYARDGDFSAARSLAPLHATSCVTAGTVPDMLRDRLVAIREGL